MFVTYYPNSVYHFDFFFSFYFSLCFITIPAERAIWGINYTYVLTVESFFFPVVFISHFTPFF